MTAAADTSPASVGALVAVIIGLIVAQPLHKLFAGYWWLPISTAALVAAVIPFPSLQELRAQSSTWGTVVVASELAFLCTLAPRAAVLVHRETAGRSFKPKPLHGPD